MNQPILIWGAGAIGATLGASFLRAGEPVVFVDTAGDHVRAINRHGLSISGPIFTDLLPARAFMPEDLQGTFRRCFLCVKAHHTQAAATTLVRHLAPDGYVVSAQNGLNEERIATITGPERVIGCFVNYGADYLEPGQVHYSGRGAVVIGELDGLPSGRIGEVERLMKAFDPQARVSSNIAGFLWGKMIYGALLFATALTNDSIADVLADPRARPVLRRLALEVSAVAEAKGIRPEAFDGFNPVAFSRAASPAQTQESFDAMVAHNRRSTKTHSGIWRDLAIRKRKTEIDAQILPVVRFGQQHGVATPVAARLIDMINAIEAGIRPLSHANLADLGRATP